MDKNELLKTAKPVRFDTRQVRATLDGMDGMMTEIRIPIKPQPIYHPEWGTMGFEWKHAAFTSGEFRKGILRFAPHQPGEILYVREIFTVLGMWDDGKGYRSHYLFAADFVDTGSVEYNGTLYVEGENEITWKSPTQMPKKATRIYLRVTDVRVERLQDISRIDIKNEGIIQPCLNCGLKECIENLSCGLKSKFKTLWDSVHKKRGFGWDSNPWVWKIAFERIIAEDT